MECISNTIQIYTLKLELGKKKRIRVMEDWLKNIHKRYNFLTKSEKIVSFFMIISGILLLSNSIMYSYELQKNGKVIFYILGFLSFFGGIFALYAKSWAYKLVAIISFLQVIQIHTPHFYFNFTSPLVLNLGFVFGLANYQINVLGLIIGIYAIKGAIRLSKTFYML